LKNILNNKILYRSDIEALTNFPVIGEIIKESSERPDNGYKRKKFYHRTISIVEVCGKKPF
jgi:hypothetical protein